MRESGLFNKLNVFFKTFQGRTVAEKIRKQFFSCLKGLDSRKGLCDELESLKALYESALRFTEKEAADNGFDKDLLVLQRDLYLELEYILSFEHTDTRHHFLVVIPVADRPLMLKNCLDSLLEQCRIFQYGGFTVDTQGAAVYNKVSVFVIDDSKDETNIRQISKICADTVASGIRSYYIGLEEQTELLRQLPPQYKECLQDLLGETRKPAVSHKGASISRNIAYLYLHAFLKDFREKALIYFLDSDEEFRVKIRRGPGLEDIPFINYFYWLDKIFETGEIEVVTGKVVGDPPVSPAVMVNTFLEDVSLFFETISSASPEGKCIFHTDQQAGDSSAEYHDMVKLFGYNIAQHPREFSCSLSGDHTVRNCLEDFSKRALGFFYGLHPTRTQLYVHRDDYKETENARTVYTGNYIFKTTGLRHFIPFAGLKLRMAGPALGRILRARLKQGFVSANLPLLHKRTLEVNYDNEFRSGISANNSNIDLSLEFNRQFWGDVMLFSVEELAGVGYPEKKIGPSEISKTAYIMQDKLWSLYKERQTEIIEKTASLSKHLSNNKFWRNSGPETEDAVRNLRLFCALVEKNFGVESVSMKNIKEQIREGSHITKIINAIHSFHKTDMAWNELLKYPLSVPSISVTSETLP